MKANIEIGCKDIDVYGIYADDKSGSFHAKIDGQLTISAEAYNSSDSNYQLREKTLINIGYPNLIWSGTAEDLYNLIINK